MPGRLRQQSGAGAAMTTTNELIQELLAAAKYTLNNLDAARRGKLITAPLWLQAQLAESATELRAAISTIESDRGQP